MSNVISRPIAFSVLLVVALACSLVVVRPALATTELDQSQDLVDEMFRVQPNIGSASYNGGAQTFTAGVTGELFAIELYLQRESFTTQDLIVELHSLAPDGALLATSDPVAAADIPVTPNADWMLITFSTPPTVSAGDVLAIVVPFVPSFPTSDPAWMFGKAASDVYAGGVAWGGSIGTNSWEPYANGSDLAFTTYVRTGPPTCDLALALGEAEPVDDALIAAVGNEVQILGFDFAADAEVTIEIESTGGDLETATDMTDAFGDFGGTLVLEPGDEGSWTVRAFPTGDPDCVDVVALEIQATPPAATPAPTAPSTDDQGELPDTSLPAARPSYEPLLLVLVLAASSGSLVVAYRAASRR